MKGQDCERRSPYVDGYAPCLFFNARLPAHERAVRQSEESWNLEAGRLSGNPRIAYRSCRNHERLAALLKCLRYGFRCTAVPRSLQVHDASDISVCFRRVISRRSRSTFQARGSFVRPFALRRELVVQLPASAFLRPRL